MEDIPIRGGYERIQILGNLWVDVNLSTSWIDKFIGCVDIVKNPKNRRKINEIIKCEIRRVKRKQN